MTNGLVDSQVQGQARAKLHQAAPLAAAASHPPLSTGDRLQTPAQPQPLIFHHASVWVSVADQRLLCGVQWWIFEVWLQLTTLSKFEMFQVCLCVAKTNKDGQMEDISFFGLGQDMAGVRN